MIKKKRSCKIDTPDVTKISSKFPKVNSDAPKKNSVEVDFIVV